MAVFTYKAKDLEGKVYQGIIEAASAPVAAQTLTSRGWVPFSIVPKLEKEGLALLIQKIRGVGSGEKVIFTRQLATMVGAGLPVTQSLDILKKQAKNDRMTEIIEETLHNVESGGTLSASFSKYPDVFDRVYVNLIKAGEASGNLDKILLRLADNEEKSAEFSSKVKGAMVYPTIVMVVMIIVFVIMMTFVVPKLMVMYKDLDTELPLPTQVMIGISNLFTQKWWLLLAIAAGVYMFYRYFTSTEYGIRKIAEVSFKIPILGNLRKQTELAELTRTLSLLVSAGLPILDSLSIVGEAVENVLYREAIASASKQVERGINLSVPLKRDTNFPPILSQMISVGEETGKLDEVLGKVSQFFESEAETTVKNLTVTLEPIIMIVLGVVVGALVVSVILPIYKLKAQF